MDQADMSRRNMLAACGGVLTAASIGPRWLGAAEQAPFPIGICDWNTGAAANPAALAFARKAGIEGVQVSFGKPGGAFDLRNEAARKKYVQAIRDTGVGYASLAMGVLNKVPFATSPDAQRWVGECLETMATINREAEAMGDLKFSKRTSTSIVLLAFFGKGDIQGKPDLMRKTIEGLKKLAPRAEKANLVIGLETWLNVEDHLKILNAVDSPAVQVYYDTANMTKRGYDIHAEIKTLGRKRICQVHAKENGALLGQGKVDFAKLKTTLTAIDYHDWLVIESAQPKGMDRLKSHTHNADFLKQTFRGNKP